MTVRAQLTFVPSHLAPAGGSSAPWARPDDADDQSLLDAASALDLPAGVMDTFASLDVVDGEASSVDRHARLLPVLPVVRRLAALPPGADWPAWRRPSASVLGWSVAAKLGLELVAAGRLLPGFAAADVPGTGSAWWRLAAPADPRIAQLASALPVAAHALRRTSGAAWTAEELLAAFLDAVADTCAREGRRPELDARRRGPRRPWGEMWAAALAGSDPTVEHLRVPAEEVALEVEEWAAPLLGRDQRAVTRLALRLRSPTSDEQATEASARADRAPWRLEYLLGAAPGGHPGTRHESQTVDAATVWSRPQDASELGGRRVDDPEAELVRGLASAARLFAPIDRSLSQIRPSGVELDGDEVAALLDDGIDALNAGGIDVEVPPELRDVRSRKLRLRIRLGRATPDAPRVDGADPLGLGSITDLRYEVALGEDVLGADEFARIVALREPLVRWRGGWVRVDHAETDRLAELAGHTASLELAEALAAALSGQHHVDELGAVETVADGAIGSLVERLRREAGPGEARVVDIDGELRDYQQRGVAWLQRLTELGMGGVLADEMGLGKTIQAMALMTSRAQGRPHLVVCPTSVVGTWERELARFAPKVPVIAHHGPDRPVTSRSFEPGHVAVTSYALLRRDIGMLEDVDWDVVVLDEAQQIKNPTSKGARAARSLRARARVAMTGTPVENRLSELWAIVDVTNPGLLGSRRTFNERFAAPIERWRDEDAAARLRRLVAPFVLRRRKSDPEVSVDLPPKQELTVACSLTREQAALYQAAVEAAFSGDGLGSTTFERRGRILALLTALKQICNHPAHYLRDGDAAATRSGKLTRASEILTELVEAGDHALVFTQFREMGELLAGHLTDALGLEDVPFLHGGVPMARRDAMVERFQHDDDAPPILLVSLRAGGTGLNLTRASHVLHFDRWWNPAVEDQATDRAHRIGQTRSVTVHTLVTAGTIEERIADLLERKRSLADAVVGTGEDWIADLADEDLRELVALSTADLADDDDDETDTGPPPATASERPALRALDGGRR